MPPRKKPKLTAQAENAQSPANTPAGDGAAHRTPSYDLVADPWTDEQETALLKGIIKWKPVGMHKHFRMVAISEFMKSQGYAPSDAEHTRIPGIWKKLGNLYNLPALDEREDSLITDISDEADGKEVYCSFELPEDEYAGLMFERRLAMEGSPSPAPSGQAESRRGSTVADTDEQRSSPAPSRGRKPGRGGRPAVRGTRSSRLNVEVEPRLDSPTSENEDEESDESDEESEEEESDAGKEDIEEDEDEEDAGSSPTGRSTRAQTSRSKRGSRRGGGVSRRGRRRQN
ncbi:chromatin modification-related protein EAF7-domain-containing protein [Aspergillus cavernicola]|uniref:Chromatin modification-related protein EAF7-domain-containing protein n=1 Tax=Aspergillus cavernicola TaxID=176166 RepID=A0ABR4IAY0_9EURO